MIAYPESLQWKNAVKTDVNSAHVLDVVSRKLRNGFKHEEQRGHLMNKRCDLLRNGENRVSGQVENDLENPNPTSPQ